MSAHVVASLLLGESLVIRRLRALITRLAPARVPVLIQGPTGAGKELVAQALHVASGRTGALVAVNVCAMTESMLEAALFGHVRGAFTGAVTDARGFLTEADEGTLFLDEISGLSASAQPKLLRALETREFRPVGARHDRRSEFRLVAASNESLERMVQERRFRLDLYHRLRAALVEVPSLEDRREDIPILARHFARAERADAELTPDAIETLMTHRWDGNVRELRNVIECALALAPTSRLDRTSMRQALHGELTPRPFRVEAPERDEWRDRLRSLLTTFDGDTMRVAGELGLHRSTIYRLMRRAGITPPRRTRMPAEESALGAPEHGASEAERTEPRSCSSRYSHPSFAYSHDGGANANGWPVDDAR